MFSEITQQFSQVFNITSFLSGLVIGVLLILTIQAVIRFMVKHWKGVLILSALISSISLLLFAL